MPYEHKSLSTAKDVEAIKAFKGPFSFSDVAGLLPDLARQVVVDAVKALASHGIIDRESLILGRRVKRKRAAGSRRG
jgi:hypothetical protein